ncbi:LysR substrate-binding domain-containing protein [Thalassobaculum sp.]|uniref:LysR substrate-binding domain-containing protein n=1 Tax=Thalassobaculum sp. TaxID=2022740 RepID=UPI0032EDD806
MATLRALLPSANALIVFEAAGRLGSFTRAAEELGISQAAVSFAIRKMEDELGTPLFRRRHRSVELTEAGRRFHPDVALGLTHIRKAAEDLTAARPDRHVTLSASTTFASFWMLPRLARFRADLPDIDLRIQTSDRDLDLTSEGLPLGIRLGRARSWPGCEAAVLIEEAITPIVAPAYIEQYGRPAMAADIAGHRLIHLEEPFRPRATWEDWFADLGLPPPSRAKGLLINDYVLVVQAVLGGQGIALGWRYVTDRMVADGLLEYPSDHVLRTGRAFHVVWPAGREIGENARRVRDWLLSGVEA